MEPIALPEAIRDLPKLGFFPGSTIGNLVPRTSVDLLRAMRESLGDDALLLIGMDRVKGEDVLVPAYDDAAGITAAFTSTCSIGSTASLAARSPSTLSATARSGTRR